MAKKIVLMHIVNPKLFALLTQYLQQESWLKDYDIKIIISVKLEDAVAALVADSHPEVIITDARLTFALACRLHFEEVYIRLIFPDEYLELNDRDTLKTKLFELCNKALGITDPRILNI